jgi:hypothetical protein
VPFSKALEYYGQVCLRVTKTETTAPAPSLMFMFTGVPAAVAEPAAVIVEVNAELPVGGATVANAVLLELSTLSALPPLMATVALAPSTRQTALGATVRGNAGAPVPAVVVTPKLVVKPFASVTVIAFGSFKQLFGAGAAATPTVKSPFASSTIGGFTETMLLDEVDTLIEYGALPPDILTSTPPDPHLEASIPVSGPRLAGISVASVVMVGFTIKKSTSRYTPDCTSVMRSPAYCVLAVSGVLKNALNEPLSVPVDAVAPLVVSVMAGTSKLGGELFLSTNKNSP